MVNCLHVAEVVECMELVPSGLQDTLKVKLYLIWMFVKLLDLTVTCSCI